MIEPDEGTGAPPAEQPGATEQPPEQTQPDPEPRSKPPTSAPTERRTEEQMTEEGEQQRPPPQTDEPEPEQESAERSVAKHSDDDLDHHKGEARRSARSRLLKTLGFESENAAKNWVDERRKQESEGATAMEAGQRALDIANRRIVRTEAKDIANDAGVRSDRITDVLDHAELGDVEPDDNGEVDRAAVRAEIVRVLERYPEWGKPRRGQAPGALDNTGNEVPTGIDARILEAFGEGNWREAERLRAEKLTAEGKLEHPT